MERIVIALLAAALIGLIGYLMFFNNPYEPEVAALKEEAERLDQEITTAQSQADCENLATQHLARRLMEATSPPVELKPNLEELLFPSDPYEFPNPMQEDLEEMQRTVGEVFSASGDGALYLIACLRHLQEIGVQDMDESFDDIWRRVISGN